MNCFQVKKKAGTGMTSAKYDVYIINPQGKQFKSKQELKLFLEKQVREESCNIFLIIS